MEGGYWVGVREDWRDRSQKGNGWQTIRIWENRIVVGGKKMQSNRASIFLFLYANY